MNALHEQLLRLSDQVRRRQPHIRGEESTKQALILPFLSVLGYDVHDPTEVEPEYVADFAKRRSGGPLEKVDYAIRRDGAPVIFVECKAVDCEPRSHNNQLARYFNATPSVPIAILSNGLRYVFYTDLQEKNILSEQPFFEFNILNFTPNDADILESFTRNRYDPVTIRERAEEIIYTSKIIGYMGELLRSPTDSFTRFVLNELNMFANQRITAKLVEKFIPTIRHAIQTTLLDMATRSIRESGNERVEAPAPPPPAKPEPPAATKPQPPAAAKPQSPATPRPQQPAVASPPVKLQQAAAAPAKPEAAPSATAAPAKASTAQIVTTPEELDSFEIVRTICASSPLQVPVVYRDTSAWFTISAGSPRKWFVRLFYNQKKKSITTRLPHSRAFPLAPGFEVESFQDGSRIYVNNPSDLHRLQALLVLAYEEEVKRKESAGDDETPTTAS